VPNHPDWNILLKRHQGTDAVSIRPTALVDHLDDRDVSDAVAVYAESPEAGFAPVRKPEHENIARLYRRGFTFRRPKADRLFLWTQ